MGRDDTVRRGAHEIATRDWGGKGEPIILLPGGGRNLADWEVVVPWLVDRHRVVGVDLPGHGASSEPESWSWDLAIHFVEAASERLELVNPFVVGHSLGGMVAARYGLKHPDCPGVVNVDGQGLGGPSVPPELHEARAKLMEQQPTQPPDAGDERWLQAQLDAMRSAVEALGLDWEAAKPAIMRSYATDADGTWRRRPSNAFIATLPTDMGPELYDIYRQLRCPVLVFNCTRKEAGPFTPVLAAAYRQSIADDLAHLASESPHVQIATVDSGHMCLLEAPETTAEHLLAFTRQHR